MIETSRAIASVRFDRITTVDGTEYALRVPVEVDATGTIEMATAHFTSRTALVDVWSQCDGKWRLSYAGIEATRIEKPQYYRG